MTKMIIRERKKVYWWSAWKGWGQKYSKRFFSLTYRDFMPIFVHTRSFKATFTKRTRLFFAKKKTPEKGTGRVPRASFRSGWALLYLLPRPIIGSLSKDDAHSYGNASKQEYYWLKEEKYTCCTCNTNFRAFLCRTPQNNNVKSPNFRFWEQREHITMKQSFSVLMLKPFVPIQLQRRWLGLYFTRWTRQNNREILAKLFFVAVAVVFA